MEHKENQALNKIGNKLVDEESGDKGLSATKVCIKLFRD
jgi:hypothetical protein